MRTLCACCVEGDICSEGNRCLFGLKAVGCSLYRCTESGRLPCDTRVYGIRIGRTIVPHAEILCAVRWFLTFYECTNVSYFVKGRVVSIFLKKAKRQGAYTENDKAATGRNHRIFNGMYSVQRGVRLRERDFAALRAGISPFLPQKAGWLRSLFCDESLLQIAGAVGQHLPYPAAL